MPIIKFCKVKIGQRFFDSNSGEYWTKISANYGRIESGGDHGTNGLAMFMWNELVEVA